MERTIAVADEIREAARTQYVEAARRQGKNKFQIVVGDVHKLLRLQNRVPAVCSALAGRKFLEENGLELEGSSGPASGMSTTVVYTYRFRGAGRASTSLREHFDKYRGVGREVFGALGGGEEFIRREREAFEKASGEQSEPGSGSKR
jgi:hypothetical protein